MAGSATRSTRGHDRRLLAVGALALVAIAWISTLVDRDPDVVPLLSTVVPTAAIGACTPIGLSRRDGTGITDLGRIQLISNTYLAAHLCEPTLVKLKAEGSAGDGLGARLTISHGTDSLFDDVVTASIDVQVVAEAPGWLLIAFGNDFYRPPEDRNLTLTDIEFTPLTARRVDEP